MMQPALRSVMVIWRVLTVLFVFTYPLNTAGDAANYLAMILHRKSNLVHASGYPFVIGPLLRLIERLPTVAHAELLKSGRAVRCSAGGDAAEDNAAPTRRSCGGGCRLCWDPAPQLRASRRARRGRLLGHEHVRYEHGLDRVPRMAAGGCPVRHGVLLRGRVFRRLLNRRKVRAYIAAGATFGLAFLVKYNSLVLGVIFLALMLFETMPWRLRWLTAFGCAAAFVLVTGFHFFFFHYPSTRATSFHHDSGWGVHGAAGHRLRQRRDRGLLGHQHAAVSRAHARDTAGLQLRPRIPKHQRRRPAGRQGTVSRGLRSHNGDAAVRTRGAYIDGNRLPPTFMLSVSAIPIYHYVGLREGDDLATKVFLEFVRDNPSRFAAAVARAVAGSSITDTARPLVPLEPGAAGLRPTRVLASAHTEYEPTPPAVPHTLTYWSPRLICGSPDGSCSKRCTLGVRRPISSLLRTSSFLPGSFSGRPNERRSSPRRSCWRWRASSWPATPSIHSGRKRPPRYGPWRAYFGPLRSNTGQALPLRSLVA